MASPKRVLLADNNLDYLNSHRQLIEKEGFLVLCASNPADASQLLDERIVDIAVIDIQLLNDMDAHDTSGLEIAKASKSSIPIIMVTDYETIDLVREALRPRVDGTQPAVDFVAKNEGATAIITAIRKTLLRKRLSPQILGSPDLQLDVANRSLRVGETITELTIQEFTFIEYLFRRPNQVISREEIVRNALGEKDEYDSNSDAGRLDTMLGRLRKKFEPDPAHPRYLVTVRGHGFKMII